MSGIPHRILEDTGTDNQSLACFIPILNRLRAGGRFGLHVELADHPKFEALGPERVVLGVSFDGEAGKRLLIRVVPELGL